MNARHKNVDITPQLENDSQLAHKIKNLAPTSFTVYNKNEAEIKTKKPC